MHRLFGYVCLKVSGILASVCRLDGQIGILPHEKYVKFIHVMIYHDTIDLGVSKSHPTWDIAKPFFNQLRHINSWFFTSIFGLGLRFCEVSLEGVLLMLTVFWAISLGLSYYLSLQLFWPGSKNSNSISKDYFSNPVAFLDNWPFFDKFW